MRKYFVLSAVGANRPGVVAQVSELIYKSGCNLEDSRMTLLGNQFALQILVSGEAPGFAEELREGCGRLERESGLPVYLFPAVGDEQTRSPEISTPNYELRVVGRDRAGIVFRTSSLLASLGINIVDLETRIETSTGEPGPILFMHLQVAVPSTVDGRQFRRDLQSLAEELNVEVTLSRRSKHG